MTARTIFLTFLRALRPGNPPHYDALIEKYSSMSDEEFDSLSDFVAEKERKDRT